MFAPLYAFAESTAVKLLSAAVTTKLSKVGTFIDVPSSFINSYALYDVSQYLFEDVIPFIVLPIYPSSGHFTTFTFNNFVSFSFTKFICSAAWLI